MKERTTKPDKHSPYFKLVYQALRDKDIQLPEFAAAIRVLLNARLSHDASAHR